MCDLLAPKKMKEPQMNGNPDGAQDGGTGLLIDGYRRRSKEKGSVVGDSPKIRSNTLSSSKEMEYAGGFEDTATGQSDTSIFDPVLCELVYRWFSPESGTVLDPFAGGSVRGIVASKLGGNTLG